MLTADAMSTVRHLSVVWTHLRPSELLLLVHCGLLEHLFSTLHQPHNRPPFVMQALQSVKLEHSSTGRRWTFTKWERGEDKRDVKGLHGGRERVMKDDACVCVHRSCRKQNRVKNLHWQPLSSHDPHHKL